MTASSSNILNIEGTPENLIVLRQLLTGQGCRVRPALSGEIALNEVQVDCPNLILLDVMMPGMGGFEICRKLKSEDRTRDVPIFYEQF